MICDEWKSFEAFIRAVGLRPSPDLTLDREDNDKGYEPGNCHWVTRVIQANNTRKNVKLIIRGKVYSIDEAAKEFGLKYHTLKRRLLRRMSAEMAVSIPQKKVGVSATKEQVEEIIKLSDNGMSQSRISKQTGYSQSYISALLIKARNYKSSTVVAK